MGTWIYPGFALLFLIGCESETGLIFEVASDESVTEAPEELHFFVGTREPDVRGNFVDDTRESGADVAGRDLFRDPYRLLVRPSQSADAEIMVAVLGLVGDRTVAFGAIEAPVRFSAGEVRLWEIVLGDAPSDLNVSEHGCLSWSVANDFVRIGAGDDQDCDGVPGDEDCNDLDPSIAPGKTEACANGVDDNCNGEVDEVADEDQDGFTNCDDCDDWVKEVNPDATEVCDGVDNNCDGACDDGEFDKDGDRYTTCGTFRNGDGTCIVDEQKLDCDDTTEFVHPGKVELCDGLDNDCNGICEDHGGDLDKDGDGFTVCGSQIERCGRSESHEDCDDEDATTYPGAHESCGMVDQNCDGSLQEIVPCYVSDSDSCTLGAASCNPDTGIIGSCLGDGGQTVSPVGCELTGSCAADDPLICLYEETDTHTSCRLTYVNGQLCPSPIVPLPAGVEVCDWSILTGATAGDFGVGLRAPGGTTIGTVNFEACMAELAVRALDSDPDGPGEALIARTDGSGTVIFRILLSGLQVKVCEQPVIECKDLAP